MTQNHDVKADYEGVTVSDDTAMDEDVTMSVITDRHDVRARDGDATVSVITDMTSQQGMKT